MPNCTRRFAQSLVVAVLLGVEPGPVLAQPQPAPGGAPPAASGRNGAAPSDSPPPSAPATPPAASVEATPPVAVQRSEQITRGDVEELRARLAVSTEIGEELRKQIGELLQKASAQLDRADSFAADKANFLKAAAEVPAMRASLDRELAALQASKPARPNALDELPALEQTFIAKQQELLQAQNSLQQVERKIEEREERQRTSRDRLAKLPQLAEAVTQELARLSGAEPTLLDNARRAALLAERKRLAAEPEALQAELAAVSAEEAVNLLPLNRQLWTTRVTRLKDEVDSWKHYIDGLKQKDADSRAGVAAANSESQTLPELQSLYRQNVEIAERESRVRGALRAVQAEVVRTTREQENLQKEKEAIKSREGKIGASASFGIRLREKQQALPDPYTLRQSIRERSDTFVKANLDLLDLRETHQRLDDLEAQIESALDAALGPEISDEELEQLEGGFRHAYTQRRDYLDHLIRAQDDYIQALDDLNFGQEELAALAVDFRTYINERVLWIPTHAPLTFPLLTSDTRGLASLFDRNAWAEVGAGLGADARARLPLYALFGLFWGGLLVTLRWQRRQIRALGQRAGSRLNTSMQPTASALMWTLLKSLTPALPFLFLGWRMEDSPVLHVHRLGEGVRLLGEWILGLEFVRCVCRPAGLGQSHFQWSQRVSRTVASQIAGFLALSIPLLSTIAVLHSRSQDGQLDVLERVTGVAFFLLLAFLLHQLTASKLGILREWNEAHPGGWIDRLTPVWHFVVILGPLALAGLLIAGYAYAAQQLCIKLAQTLMLVFGAIFLRALLVRWLTMHQRRLAIEHAREIRAALARAKADNESGSVAVLEAQEARINLTEVSAQSRRLLNTTIVVLSLLGIWRIWIDVLPALRYFDRWEVFGIGVPITSLGAALLVTVLTATAARNVPGLLEITVLERLPIEKSVRYAVGAITRYAIVVIGIWMVGKTLRIEWEHIQWLAAALTFGLGFGLQEIFANFVSGIIILFERPVRVGDIVTIDGISGTVTRIRIRSTTITDWDRKDYIVPNREFITGKLLNWTLTDSMNRVVIQVGVAYGSDPTRVRELLLEIVRTQPHVLTEPSPMVVFEAFGDSALQFAVRAFLPSLEHRQETIHALHSRIHEVFQAEGIEIPFPQRDLHLRSAAAPLLAERPENAAPVNGEERHEPASAGRA